MVLIPRFPRRRPGSVARRVRLDRFIRSIEENVAVHADCELVPCRDLNRVLHIQVAPGNLSAGLAQFLADGASSGLSVTCRWLVVLLVADKRTRLASQELVLRLGCLIVVDGESKTLVEICPRPEAKLLCGVSDIQASARLAVGFRLLRVAIGAPRFPN